MKKLSDLSKDAERRGNNEKGAFGSHRNDDTKSKNHKTKRCRRQVSRVSFYHVLFSHCQADSGGNFFYGNNHTDEEGNRFDYITREWEGLHTTTTENACSFASPFFFSFTSAKGGVYLNAG